MTARLAALLVVLAGLSLLVGGGAVGWPEPFVLWQLRLPRTCLAALVGGGLGLAGAALQGALRNPLADSGLLGVGGCGTLAAVVAFYWGLSQWWPPLLPLAGMAGAGAGAVFLLLVAASSGPGLILAGVALSAAAAALTTLALALAPNPFALAEITAWLMGGVADRGWRDVALAGPPVALGCALLLRQGPVLDGLALGEAVAASLGVPVAATLRVVAVGVALAVGGGAAVAGSIGFVGLMVPHALRPLVGERPGALLLPSLLAGAGLLVAADLGTRLLPWLWPSTGELPVGVLTALLGAPLLARIARRAAP